MRSSEEEDKQRRVRDERYLGMLPMASRRISSLRGLHADAALRETPERVVGWGGSCSPLTPLIEVDGGSNERG
jgi:hypothetical protein